MADQKRVRIWHQLHKQGDSLAGIVTATLPDGWIKAEIEDEKHPLHLLQSGEKRVLTVSPDLYEVME